MDALWIWIPLVEIIQKQHLRILSGAILQQPLCAWKNEAECATIEARRVPRRTEREGGNEMFRGARHSDLEQILDIYARARKAMAASGNPTQWGDSYPPREMLEKDIDANRLFIYTVNGRLEAVFAFILGPDPTYAKIEGGKC